MADSSNKRIAKNTIMLYLRMLVMMVLSLFTSRIVLQTLGITDYGVYSVVAGAITLVSFLTDSLSAGSNRFITIAIGQDNIENTKKVFGNVLCFHIFVALGILILGETIGLWFVTTQLVIPVSRFYAAMWVYQVSMLSCVAGIMAAPFYVVITSHEKMSIYAYFSILDAALKLAIVYLLFIGNADKLILYSLLLFVAQAISISVNLWYCFVHFKEVHIKPGIDRDISKQFFTYSGWTLTGALTTMTSNQGVNMFLNIFYGPAVNAARGVAMQVQTAILTYATNFQLAARPQIVKCYAVFDFKRMHELMDICSRYSFYLLLVLSCPLLINLDFVLNLWLVEVPEYTLQFVTIILITSVLHCSLAAPLIFAVNATGDVKTYQLVEGGLLIMVLPVSYILVKCWTVSPIWVFAVISICEAITQIVRIFIVLPKVKLPIKHYLKKTFRPIAFITGIVNTSCILLYKSADSSLLKFLITSIIIEIIIFSSVYYLGVEKHERKFLIQFIRKKINVFSNS